MVGLGETEKEVTSLMENLRRSHVTILTIGQYLQPTKAHYPVKKFYTPKEFDELKEIGLGIGFKHVESGPLVRSSYKAEQMVRFI